MPRNPIPSYHISPQSLMICVSGFSFAFLRRRAVKSKGYVRIQYGQPGSSSYYTSNAPDNGEGGREGGEGGGREEGREGRGENVDTCFTEWCYWRSVMLMTHIVRAALSYNHICRSTLFM